MHLLNVEVDFAPKGHCEIAGRGVERVWGVSELLFRKHNANLDNEDRVKNIKDRVKTLLENIGI